MWWLWTAYAVSTAGTWLAFDAFPMIAILVLDVGPAQVSTLAAAGLAVGAVLAVPLGPWVEVRRKRPVMIAMDLVRFAAVLSVPVAFAFGVLGFAQLLVVSVVVVAADITFTAASGALVKALARPEELLRVNGRFEATMWTASALGPPLGTAALGMFGPVITVVANGISYVLSASALRMVGQEPDPVRSAASRFRFADLVEGWRFVLADPVLRPLLFNTLLVNGLIMAISPPFAVLMLGELGFAPWQYGVAFGVACLGGLIGSRLAHPLVARFGRHRVMITAGVLRACWSIGLVFVQHGVGGLVLVIGVEFALILCAGVFNPVFATYRLDRVPKDRVVRVLSAWSITGKAATATLTALWGVLAGLVGARTAIVVAGFLLLATPLLLPRRSV
ncbi:MFS transporter [Allokutzneria albata]|uniref:MFS-type transporter involved in bile tolerance, Atg22 family n=1 Tax=Allokutzneria albata TaxID=211114 RepID=A0A1G9ST13_ALLAB|nr:MFS transporter [Allokutzneria albata]SDM38588.1 MFS-type transporter involved in bile tolerance, Atg22 family [Allokutzneria albata]